MNTTGQQVRGYSREVKNSAGGYVYQVDPLQQVARFLVLGSEGGSYYTTEQKLTQENTKALQQAIAEHGPKVVDLIVEISTKGRAPKEDPCLFALALCAAVGNDATRAAAMAALPHVARIGTHLFHFAAFVDAMRGWGMGLRRGVAKWYMSKYAADLAYDAVKYQQRDGWSHRDLLRKVHPQAKELRLGKVDGPRNAIFSYMVDGWENIPEAPAHDGLDIIWAAEKAKTANEAELVRLIENYGLPMECVPTDKRTQAIYAALLAQPQTGLTWVIRNLGNLGKNGVLKVGQYTNIQRVLDRLGNVDQLKRARVHPLSLLTALVYGKGRGVRGDGEWQVVPQVKTALETAFYNAFDTITPVGKRFVLGLDVSSSMTTHEIAKMPGITSRIGAAAMAMATLKTEPFTLPLAFSRGVTYRDLNLVGMDLMPNMSLEEVIKQFEAIPYGPTDCAAPMVYALENGIETDAFVIYTDSETWYGNVKPMDALLRYRAETGIDAKLIVVGMVSNGFTIADPKVRGCLDVVGFDTSAPSVINQVVAGLI